MPVSTAHDLTAPNFVAARFAHSIETSQRFFAANAETVSQASFQMARRFERGGRLLAFGTGSSATDAQHVAVESRPFRNPDRNRGGLAGG